MERLSREYRVSIAVPILQGLLASGQFTNDDGDVIKVKRIDCGPKWQTDGYARSHMSAAVLMALNLAKELVDQTELEAEKGV
jgi:hypothetical protein